jgi:uncharacterized protein (TIGR03086 family)
MTVFDLGPATGTLADLVAGIPDDKLGGPTPCPAYTVGDLLEHVGGLAQAFAAGARKEGGALTSAAPAGDATRLPKDWRTRIPADLNTLAVAWQDPAAWTGMTTVGGVNMPGEVTALVALDEVVIHSWDVARSTGQLFSVEPGLLQALSGFLSQAFAPDQPAARKGIFGPPVDVPEDAPLLDRVIGLTGRDPSWTPDRSQAKSAARP